MANWKKVVVSGSSPDLHLITGSGLQLTNPPHSSDTTPLVIDSNGNVFTGSKYAKASGGTTVGANGANHMTSSVAIVGVSNADGTPSNLIQTASKFFEVDFNSSSLQSANHITASGIISGATSINAGGYDINNTNLAEFVGSELVIGHATNTTISSSKLNIKASGGITASVVPETIRPSFYLGQLDGGEIVKIALGNVDGGGGGTGIVGINSGDNVNISNGASSTEEILIATKTTTSENGITGSKDNFNFDLVNVGDTIKLRFEDATEVSSLTIAEIVTEDAGEINNNGALVFNETLDVVKQGQSVVSAYKAITTTIGAPTINLNDSIDITGSISMSNGGDIMFSGSNTEVHQIYPFGWGSSSINDEGTAIDQATVLNISASNITASTIGAETFFLNGFTFANDSIINTSASTNFGDAITDTHTFTGSVFISASNITLLGVDGEQGTITAPSFSGDGGLLTNLNSAQLSLGGLKAGGGISVGTDLLDDSSALLVGSGSRIYNPTGSQLEIKINVDNDTIEITNDKLRVKENSIGAAELDNIGPTPGQYGTSTGIPQITVDQQGRITSIGTQSISSTLTIAANGDSSGDGTGIVIGTDTLNFVGSTGITTVLSNNTITISADRTGQTFTGTTSFETVDINGSLTVDGSDISLDSTTTLNIDNSNTTNGIKIGTVTSGVPITIGHANSTTTIGNNLSVGGTLGVGGNTTLANVSMSGDLNLAGNLHVHGTTTTFNTTNLDIEDRFILLGSGSANATANLDTGIIFEAGNQDGVGTALYHDAGLSRISIAKSVDNATVSDVSNGTIAGHVVTVKYNVASPVNDAFVSGVDENGDDVITPVTAAEFGDGEMIIDSSKDIWIYTS